ncbi:MAG: prolyl oligopeptidase family serine peptidase [Chlamydiae bacterium]|nr:prolyl oligopeptidase family serine peptidase [Chlamydiota bacterium]
MAIKISPDGHRLAYVGADRNGTMNVYLTSGLSLAEFQQITDFKEPEIKGFYWLHKNNIILLKDANGTGQFRLYSVALNSGKIKDLTAEYKEINAKVFQVNSTEAKAIIGINNRNPMFHDLYLLDCKNNSLSKIYQNDQFINFVFDSSLNLVIKIKMNEDSSITLLDKENDVLFNISAEDAFHTECLRFNEHENALYLLDNRNCNTTQLKKIIFNETHTEILLGEDQLSDILDVHFENNKPVAYSTYFMHQKWHPLNDKIKSDLDYLSIQIGKNFEIFDQSSDDQSWILKNSIPDQGIEFWLYNRPTKRLALLYSYPEIKNLAKMYALLIPSSDGLNLVSYLTLPKDMDQGGKPKKPLPLVVVPHGGPFKVRDIYEYSLDHQWLSNRGYAVLSVNFRLSSGFGKKFVNAGNGQWGKRAHQDILDAVKWCINAKIAKKDKIAVFGGSYGGYEALASLTFSPEVFACAVAICGPSNLKTVLDKVPFYWEFPISTLSDKMMYFTKNAFIKSMGGNPNDENEIPYLHSCSPLNHVDKIQKPLLLVHGVNDPIVAASESDQIFEKMQQKELPVTYISFPDEGHGITKFDNMMCYLAYSEWLLAQFLGGTYEPLSEKEVQSSSAVIRSHGMIPKEVISADKK